MTISTELRKAGPFTGNGVTTAFPFSFKVFAATDVTATRADTLDAETVLVLNTDFTVALNADQDAAPGGTVTLAAPLSTGYRLVVSSAVPNLQPTDITNNGGFYPRVIEDALDRHVAQIQQIDEKVARALKVAITSPLGDQALPSPVAGMLIGWNESSDGLKNYAPIGGTLLGQQLAAANGSSLVGFQQAGAGAVVRTAQDKMREWVSVKDFGGKHDSASIDSAIRVRAWGDSLTAGAGGVPYPEQLYALAPFAAVTNSGVGGETSTQIKARFDAGLDTIAWTQIIWAGRNNYSETATVLSDIAGMVAQIPHPRFLALSVLNSTLEAKGSAGYNHFITIRDSLKEAYPANFWDVRGYLINSGLAAVGISPTSQDLVDIENDVVPSSLRSDHIHLNSAGYKAVALGLRARLYELFEIIPERKDLTSMALVDNRAGSRVLTQRVEIAGPPGNATSVCALSTSGNGLSVQIDGGFIPSAHNAYDLGAGGLLEWRDGLFARRVRAPKFVVAADNGPEISRYSTSPERETDAQFNGALIPLTHNAYDLGHGGIREWRDGLFARRLRTPTYYVGADDTGGQIKLSGDSAAVQVSKEWSPYTDNAQSLGRGSLRWSVVYAGTGTISTSDGREKQQVRDLSDAERAVAVRMKGLVRAFKFNDAVVQKGDNARIHFGVIAQEVKAAFEAEGLVAEDYAVLCYDEWDEQLQEHRPAGNRYGVRYEELLAFIIATL